MSKKTTGKSTYGVMLHDSPSPSSDLVERPKQQHRHEPVESSDQVYSSIRDTVSGISPKRYDEIFEDFAVAVDKHDIDLLAKTIAKWAMGGNEGGRDDQPTRGYQPVIRRDDNEEMSIFWNEMWSPNGLWPSHVASFTPSKKLHDLAGASAMGVRVADVDRKEL